MTITKDVVPHGVAGTRGTAAAIRAATHRALAARDLRLQEYPRWEEWRRQARDLKAAALVRLDEYLQQLAQAVTAWGGTVLWARDAAQARSLILEVARRHRVTAVVKSKSMTTEEIALNPALEAHGIRVRETDLGEFIVQLAGDPPAHLTAPALHLDRHRIAAIFQEHLGWSGPAEPQALTRLATAYLKPHFWEAQMGITGVNCAAPDGTLVLVENESNLRLTATLPPIHLALMGMEKIIPELPAAEVLLRLLPPSATGQRLTALVHFLRGLKPHPQGQQAFYLVILDNGRRRLAREPELAGALSCLRCGACLNICPVFQEGAAHLYGRVYPGAIGILLAPFLKPTGDICDLCTQCGACQDICPVMIRLADRILGLRERSRRYRSLRAMSGVAGLILCRPHFYRALEGARRALPPLMRRSRAVGFLGEAVAPESFHQQHRWRVGGGGQGQTAPAPSPKPPPPTPYRGLGGGVEEGGGNDFPRPSPITLLTARLQEAGSSCREAVGVAALAKLLAQAGSPLWLEEHPWLRQAAPELEKLGVQPRLAGDVWAPEAESAVIVALGAIPETGSIIIDAAAGPGSWLSYRVRRQVVLVPRDRAALSLAQALELVGQRPPGMTTWLTGPSRTADIEKVLVLGAQGPAHLDVIIYEGEPVSADHSSGH